MLKLRKFRCPWCGEEVIGMSKKAGTFLIGRTKLLPKCPMCEKYYSIHAQQPTIISKMSLAMTISLGLLIILYVFLALLKGKGKSEDVRVKIAMELMPGLLLLFVMLVIVVLINRYYFYSLIRLKENKHHYGQYEQLCFNFAFYAKIYLHSFKNGGHWNPRLYLRNGTILGVKFDTNNKKRINEIFAVVFDKVKHKEDETECICGFILSDSTPKNILKIGLTFTVIDNGKEIATGKITKGVVDMVVE